MKISYLWLKKYIALRENPNTIANLLIHSGLENTVKLGSSQQEFMQDLVVGKILTCIPHPNADKLHITTVDIGSKILKIICGATNIAVEQKVVVAPVGTTLYTPEGKKWKIKKAKIRGEYSYGMICSAEEIGLHIAAKKHANGILVLQENFVIGTSLQKYFPTDAIFDLEITPNRADALSHIGVARELAALLNIPYVWPEKKNQTVLKEHYSYNIHIHSLCPRFSALMLYAVNLQQPIPYWLSSMLQAIDIFPKDIFSALMAFVMYETGQPLFAFDIDKVQEKKNLVITYAQPHTQFITSGGKKICLTGEELVIADEKGPIALAGVDIHERVMVTDQTKNILLTSAYFIPKAIQKTLSIHHIHTPESYRYARGTDPHVVVDALQRASYLLENTAIAEVNQPIVDVYSKPIPYHEIKICYETIDKTIGKRIPKQKIKHILKSLGILIDKEDEKNLCIHVPPYRVDVHRPIDIIEEIIRILGYNTLDTVDTLHMVSPINTRVILQEKVQKLFVAHGFHEIYTHAFSHSKYYENVVKNKDKLVMLTNPLSHTLDCLKMDFIFSGLEAIAYNLHRKQTNIKLFEFGKVYLQEKKHYIEKKRLGLWITGNTALSCWHNVKIKEVSWRDAKIMVWKILAYTLGEKREIAQTIKNEEDSHYYNGYLEFLYQNKSIALLGQVKKKVLAQCKITMPVFYAEFDWDLLLSIYKENNPYIYHPISKYPAVKRDLSIIIDESILYENIRKHLIHSKHPYCKKFSVIDVYRGSPLEKNKKVYTLSFILQAIDKTLDEDMIETIMQNIIDSLSKAFNAIIRTS